MRLTVEQHRSIRALRRLHLAFRSAAHMNEEDQVVAWAIDSASGKLDQCSDECATDAYVVYNKLVVTTLRYTPIVLNHHVPYKTLANGK